MQAMDAAPGSSGAGDATRHTPSPLQRAGRIALIIGNLLMVATFFVPWLELETSFCSSGPRCHYHFGPWYLIQPGVPGIQVFSLADPFVSIIACAIAILACSILFLAIHNRKVRRFALGVLFAPCIICMFMTVYIMTLLPFGLVTSYPFFQTTAIYGALLAFGSFIAIFAGAVLVCRPKSPRPRLIPVARRSRASS